MGNITKYSEMVDLATEEFYDDVCTFLGGMNYTLEVLDYLGSCAYDLRDVIDREGESTDKEIAFSDYVRAAEDFFKELDDVNETYDAFRQRIITGMKEEYVKIKRLIAYRDDVVVNKVLGIQDIVYKSDFDKMWEYIIISKNEVNLEKLDEEYRFVLEYINVLNDGLVQFNKFGSMRHRYTDRLFTEDEIVNCDRRFYYEHEHLNPLVRFTYNVMDIERFVTAIKGVLVDKYGIELDTI